jgi:hypothetical protein
VRAAASTDRRRRGLRRSRDPGYDARVTFDDIDKMARKLAGVTVGAKWRQRTWMVDGKGFVWERPFSKADLKRFGDQAPPAGPILGVRVENLDAKDALLAMALPGFFTIPHFNGYAAVLIALHAAAAADVRAAVIGAWHAVATPTAQPRGKRVAPAGAAVSNVTPTSTRRGDARGSQARAPSAAKPTVGRAKASAAKATTGRAKTSAAKPTVGRVKASAAKPTVGRAKASAAKPSKRRGR